MNDVINVETKSVTEAGVETKAIEYLKSMGMKLPENYQRQFIELCKAYGLNPFKREIYAVVYRSHDGDKINIITGYEVYLKRAERLGKLDGWECHCEGSGNEMKAVLTIYRKDWKHEFRHEVLFSEVVQTKKDGTSNSMWSKMPSFMMKKVCIAQGFRMCFPDEFGGMPYTSDEMPEMEPVQEVRKAPEEIVAEAVEGEVLEASDVLRNLLDTYSFDLKGEPYRLASECLQNGGDCAAMVKRCETYLRAKRVIA